MLLLAVAAAKGQLISEGNFGVFKFLPKSKQNCLIKSQRKLLASKYNYSWQGNKLILIVSGNSKMDSNTRDILSSI